MKYLLYAILASVLPIAFETGDFVNASILYVGLIGLLVVVQKLDDGNREFNVHDWRYHGVLCLLDPPQTWFED